MRFKMSGRDDINITVEIPVPNGTTEDQAVKKLADNLERELSKGFGF